MICKNCIIQLSKETNNINFKKNLGDKIFPKISLKISSLCKHKSYKIYKWLIKINHLIIFLKKKTEG